MDIQQSIVDKAYDVFKSKIEEITNKKMDKFILPEDQEVLKKALKAAIEEVVEPNA